MNKVSFAVLSSAAAAFFAITTPAAAAGFLYECDMSGAKLAQGWISAKVAFVLPGDGSVSVVDAVILHANGAPLAGKVLRESTSHLHIKWTIKDLRSDIGTAFAATDYKAVITKSTGRINLSMKPRHFDRGFQSGGTCVKRSK